LTQNQVLAIENFTVPSLAGARLRHDTSRMARKYGLQQTLITACCNGRRKAHWGYKWAYYDEAKHGPEGLM